MISLAKMASKENIPYTLSTVACANLLKKLDHI